LLQLGNTDPAQSGYWSLRESFVSVVLTNMPMVYPLVKHFFEKGLSSLGGGKSDNTAYVGDSHGYPLGSHPGRNTKTTTHSKNPHSRPGDTFWGSEENIVENNVDAKTTATASSSDAGSRPKQLHGHKADPSRTPTPTSPTSPVAGMARKPQLPRHGSRNERVQVTIGQGEPPPSSHMKGIVVTAEYTVTEHHEKENRRRSGAGFAF
jgi:hypothetical protein